MNIGWAKWWQRRCPAVAFISRDNYPRCDLPYMHDGDHRAERGMDEPQWHEEWTA